MKYISAIASFAFFAFSAATFFASPMAWAQTQIPTPTPTPTPAPTAKQTLASAEVVAVYQKEKRVLLKHGPIANLGMSDMTMEFGVANPRLLSAFKRGRKVMFSAIMVKDDYIVTHVEPAK